MLRVLTLIVSALIAAPVAADRVTVFAASSLQTALDQVTADWQAETGHDVRLVYAGTSTLARQIAAGAPAHVFIAASVDWMDWVDGQDLLEPASRRDLWSNSLVLIGPAGSGPLALDAPLIDLAASGRLAMAQVDAVPAGQYGKASLTALGLWGGVAPHVVETDNARRALALVALGEVDLGVVYGSDALAEPRVSVRATFPAGSHPAIRYPGAVAAGAPAMAVELLDYLASPAAVSVFVASGFERIAP